jgi:hypothetical protein
MVKKQFHAAIVRVSCSRFALGQHFVNVSVAEAGKNISDGDVRKVF